VPRERLHRLTDTRLPILVAEELVGEETPLLVVEVTAPARVRRPGELEIDELNAKLEVTPLAVPAPGVGERLREHLRVDPGAVPRVERGERLQGLGVVGMEL
jgi:hypothetical protein